MTQPSTPLADEVDEVLKKLIDTGIIVLTKEDVLDMEGVDKYAYARERLREEQRIELPKFKAALNKAYAKQFLELPEMQDDVELPAKGGYRSYVRLIRNSLRAKLRAAVNKMVA